MNVLEVVVSFLGVCLGAYLGVYLQYSRQTNYTRDWLIAYYKNRPNRKRSEDVIPVKNHIDNVIQTIDNVVAQGAISLNDWVVLTDLIPIITAESTQLQEVQLRSVGILPNEVFVGSNRVIRANNILSHHIQICHHYRESVLLPHALNAPAQATPVSIAHISSISRYKAMLEGLLDAVQQLEEAEEELSYALYKWRPRDFPKDLKD
ncbi:MAG: hypothetical protein N2Z75_06850 [Meiothermus sp.]|uniref:hypothetical protein n=1 Tax=Meiothermus sp. TaxID=1955249 RepID=UPI0025FB1932|nr:hypothetical protein [Meiothermus sp.]MCS7069074.1 hypothetical protein [Meiothermus sp.]MCX7601641.1 hypothetical protein [Meiothermus sp.]MDW8425925.1 hypothetical protein [Meiothermus sp.]